MSANERPTTIDDLPVKLCYICREEDRRDNPENPPRTWIHPCNCTLVAHESCLLQWIQIAQQSNAENPLKCPQCGAIYELKSNNPPLLRMMESANRTLDWAGRVVIVSSVMGVVVVIGSGVYTVLTSYGIIALQRFIGKELWDILFSDDPRKWPVSAWINLPLIPLCLVVGHITNPKTFYAAIPLLVTWPPMFPVNQQGRLLLQAKPSTLQSPVRFWPPSPMTCGVLLFPIIRSVYKKYFAVFSHWVLGTKPETRRRPVRRFVWDLNDQGMFRIVVDQRDAVDPPPAAPQAPAGARGQPAPRLAPADEEETLHVTTTSTGRAIGAALLLPFVSNLMGHVLRRLAQRSHLLHAFLGIRPPLKRPLHQLFEPYQIPANVTEMGLLRQTMYFAKFGATLAWIGSDVWTVVDPVWWRNSVGLGIYTVVKDCLHLLHQWLAKRELESRSVISKSFIGVDIQELGVAAAPQAA